MKYNDNGEYKDIYIKTFDTLPVGTEVDYDGSVVPDGWSEIQDYSTSEVNTGKKWIDGKTIYRIVCDISAITSTNSNIVDLSSLGIENVTKLYGFIKDSYGNITPVPFTDSSSNYSVLFYNNAGYLRGRCALGSGGTISSAYAVVEYTKN